MCCEEGGNRVRGSVLDHIYSLYAVLVMSFIHAVKVCEWM